MATTAAAAELDTDCELLLTMWLTTLLLLPTPTLLLLVLVPTLDDVLSAATLGLSIEAHMFSFGLSLPSDTGRGLSEQGDASRDTLSESSSLRIGPVREV